MSGLNLDPLALIDSIELKSIYTPPGLKYSPNAPSDPATSAQYKNLLAQAKPVVIFHLNSGLGDRSWAPYGDPGNTNYWDYVLTGLEVGGAILGGLLVYALAEIVMPRK